MRSRLMVPILLSVVLAACADRATSPLAPAAAAFTLFDGNPPPPSLDTGAAFTSGSGQTTNFQVQYFLNKTGNNGFISFHNNAANTEFVATPNARISYHQGVVSGRGVLTFTQGANTSVFDLANVSGAVFNPDCSKTCGAFTVPGTFTNSDGGSEPTTGVFIVAPPTSVIGGGDVILGT